MFKAITTWRKEYLQQTMEKAEQEGYKVLYADTDGFYATLFWYVHLVSENTVF